MDVNPENLAEYAAHQFKVIWQRKPTPQELAKLNQQPPGATQGALLAAVNAWLKQGPRVDWPAKARRDYLEHTREARAIRQMEERIAREELADE